MMLTYIGGRWSEGRGVEVENWGRLGGWQGRIKRIHTYPSSSAVWLQVKKHGLHLHCRTASAEGFALPSFQATLPVLVMPKQFKGLSFHTKCVGKHSGPVGHATHTRVAASDL